MNLIINCKLAFLLCNIALCVFDVVHSAYEEKRYKFKNVLSFCHTFDDLILRERIRIAQLHHFIKVLSDLSKNRVVVREAAYKTK